MSQGDPRVIFNVHDLSQYIARLLAGYTTVFIQAERGPMWEPTMIAAGQEDKFIEIFGNSVDWSTDPLCCLKALRSGANLIVIRIGHCADVSDRDTLTVLRASCLIPDKGGEPTHGYAQSAAGPFQFTLSIPGKATGLELGPFTIVTATNDKFYVRVKTGGTWGSWQTVTFSQGTLTAQHVCDAINAGTDGISATVSSNKVHVEATGSTDDIEIGAISHDAYSTLGFVEAAYTHTAGTTTLAVKSNAGNEQTFDFAPLNGETGAFWLTSAQCAAQLSGLSGGIATGYQGKLTITSNTTGSGSSVQVTANSTLPVAMGFDALVHSGIEGEAVSAWKYELTGPGSYGNNATIYFYDSPLNPDVRMNFRRVVPGAPELYLRDLSRDPNDSRFWKAAINAQDKLGQIVDVDTPNDAPWDWPALNSDGIRLSGGADGDVVLTDADYVGDASARTGFYCIDMVQVPSIDFMAFGTSSAVVMAAASEFAASRVGIDYHHQVPAYMTPQEAADWRMGTPPEYSHAAFDSPSTSLMFGRPVVFDPRNNAQRLIPALPYLAASITFTDNAKDPSWSPFGMKRANIQGIHGIDYNVAEDKSSADLLHEKGINDIRIIRTHPETYGDEGCYLWGGQTCQLISSALKEFPIVRKIKQYQRMILPALLWYVHDPNHPTIWGEIDRTLRPLFRQDLHKEFIYGYALYTDAGAYFADGILKGATINTAENIDQNEYRIRLLVKFLRQIFWIRVDFGVMRTGDPWSTYETIPELPNDIRM